MQMLFVRSLTEEETAALAAGAASPSRFTRRRCQLLLASAAGEVIPEIALRYGCNKTTVWEAIHAFNRRGLSSLREQRWRRLEPCSVVDVSQEPRLRLFLQSSPADFGKRKKRWSLALLAEVCWEQGVARRELSREGMRQIVQRLGISWKQVNGLARNSQRF
ncbi:MAG: helix-turn-helix domain-containing protein [Blastocatellia bacterium]|nr:helix-turn-helix domain-containing protein [Blastocatellia bacterium]